MTLLALKFPRHASRVLHCRLTRVQGSERVRSGMLIEPILAQYPVRGSFMNRGGLDPNSGIRSIPDPRPDQISAALVAPASAVPASDLG